MRNEQAITSESNPSSFSGGAHAMTRRTLKLIVIGIIVFLLVYAALGVVLLLRGEPVKQWFDLYKSLVSLFVAVPAAILAAAFQRRTSYLGSLRDLWKQLIPAVQEAIQYTHLDRPTQDQFARVQALLCGVIDSLRGVFKNVDRKNGSSGRYPFENLKDIHCIISWLGTGHTYKRFNRADARRCITLLWQEMHAALLLEFDCEEPAEPVTKFRHNRRSLANDLIEGTLTVEGLRAIANRRRKASEGCADTVPNDPGQLDREPAPAA